MLRIVAHHPKGFARDLDRLGRGSAYGTIGNLVEQLRQYLSMTELGVQQHKFSERPIYQRFRMRFSRILPRLPCFLPGRDRAREVTVMQIIETEIGQECGSPEGIRMSEHKSGEA